MLKVFLINECATGESFSGQYADGGSSVENGLPARFYRVGQLTVMTLKIESLQALKAGEKPGFGQLRKSCMGHRLQLRHIGACVRGRP